MPALLDLRSVERARGDGFRLRIGRFRLGTRALVAIVGPSGSGKSTCLDLIAMTLRPDEAERMVIAPAGDSPTDAAALWRQNDRVGIRSVRARHFGYVLQTGGLVPFLSLYENAMLSRRLLGKRGEGLVMELFRRLGIAHLTKRKPRNVSIGERQRAAVVRALAHGPSLILADEPTASLDRSAANDVMTLLTETTTSAGVALVLVTHDRSLAADFGLPIAECRPVSTERASIIEFDDS